MPRVIALDQLQQFTAVNLLSDPGSLGGPYVVPSCARINLRWNIESGKIAHIVLVGRYVGAFHGSVAEANAIMTALTTGGTWTALAAFLATNTALAGVEIQDVNTPFQGKIFSSNAAVLGTSVSPALPNEVAAVITKRTALVGVQNRGRAYVPGFATNALGTGNVIAAAAVTALTNWGNVFGTALSGSGYTHVIGQPARAAYTGSTGTEHAARAATSTPVTSMVVLDNHWDSQRRRGLK